jgi:tRNA (guanine37-N1)-methyltransferase
VGKRIVLLTPQGKKFSHAMAKRLAKYEELIFISGRYEGFDERIRSFVDEEISIGDYVLMGGELPALVISEAVLRFVPGVLGKLESSVAESFSEGLLEYPHYTKPEKFKVGRKVLWVPKVLLTGHHANIDEWRRKEALKRTKKRRPDLLK